MTASPAAAELLTLLQVRGIGPATLLKIMRSARGRDVVAHAVSIRPELEGVPLAEAQHRAEAVVRSCERDDIAIIGYCDPDYPEPLRRIPDPPAVLYARGNVGALRQCGLAVVGTRRASPSGVRIAGAIASHLAERRIAVVSGLALGIDRAAHQGALDAGGITVAVLAHGLDTVSPRSHAYLADDIVCHDGALLSEHPPGTPPRPAEFVRRNRIQSGISVGSVVVESGQTGGSIHQARFTARQERLLLTVLKSAQSDDLNQAGAHRIVSELGAIPIRTMTDLDAQLDGIVPLAERVGAADLCEPQQVAVQTRFEL